MSFDSLTVNLNLYMGQNSFQRVSFRVKKKPCNKINLTENTVYIPWKIQTIRTKEKKLQNTFGRFHVTPHCTFELHPRPDAKLSAIHARRRDVVVCQKIVAVALGYLTTVSTISYVVVFAEAVSNSVFHSASVTWKTV